MGCGPRQMSPAAPAPQKSAEQIAAEKAAQENLVKAQKAANEAHKAANEAADNAQKAQNEADKAARKAKENPGDEGLAKKAKEAQDKADKAKEASEDARRAAATADANVAAAAHKVKQAMGESSGKGGVFSIPGKVKLDMLPFNPSTSGAVPKYSFRKNDNADCKLNVCPSSFFTTNGSYFANDIANSSLIARDASSGGMSGSVDQNSILENMPGIQFREYLQDTKLDTVLNIFSELGDIFSEDSADQSQNGKTKEKNGMFTKIAKTVKFIFSQEVIDILTKTSALTGAQYAKEYFPNVSKEQLNYILTFPYMLYYRLMGTETTGYYTIPCTQNFRLLEGDGTTGWEAKDILALGGGAIVEKLTSFFNIGSHSTPMWDPKGIPLGSEYTVKFSLFNDSIDAAVYNYMFINNVCANARPIQYHIFKHAPDLYDVKIEGGPRWYLCSGKFEVDYQGVSRKPSIDMVKRLMSYKNKKFAGTQSWMFSEDIIRIPDIYNVTCTFKSLLPENFNNFLYSFSQNNKITKWTEMHSQNAIGEYIGQCLKPAVAAIASYWKSL